MEDIIIKNILIRIHENLLKNSPTWDLTKDYPQIIADEVKEKLGISCPEVIPLVCDMNRSVCLPFMITQNIPANRERKYFVKIINKRSWYIHRKTVSFFNILAQGDIYCEYASVQQMVHEEFMLLQKIAKIAYAPNPSIYFPIDEDEFCFITEYIDGLPLSSQPNIRNMEQMFILIEKLWKHQIVHGDIKPGNFLVSNNVLYIFDPLKVNEQNLEIALISDLTHAVLFWRRKISIDRVLSAVHRYFGERLLFSVQLCLKYHQNGRNVRSA